jgi:hypothetical protein
VEFGAAVSVAFGDVVALERSPSADGADVASGVNVPCAPVTFVGELGGLVSLEEPATAPELPDVTSVDGALPVGPGESLVGADVPVLEPPTPATEPSLGALVAGAPLGADVPTGPVAGPGDVAGLPCAAVGPAVGAPDGAEDGG